MAADLTTYVNALKTVYGPRVEDQLNSATVLLKRMKRTTEGLVLGSSYVVAVEGQRSHGVGSRPGTATTIPAAGNADNQLGNIPTAYHWGHITIFKTVMEQAKNDERAFAQPLTRETKSMTEVLSMDINRQLFNDGSGIISQTGVTTAAQVVVLTTTGRYRALGNGRLEKGMVIDILTRSTGVPVANGTNRTIIAVNKAANTVTIDAAGGNVTTGVNEGIYRAGNHQASGTAVYEMAGLRNVVAAAGAVYGLNPATGGQEFWSSYVNANAGTPRAISELLLQTMVDEVEEAGPGKVTLLISSKPVRRSYFNLLVGLKRFIGSAVTKLEGGFTALLFDDMPFVVDHDAAPNAVYALDESKWKLWQLSKPQWLDDEGAMLKWNGNTGFDAVYFWFTGTGTTTRNALALLDDITES